MPEEQESVFTPCPEYDAMQKHIELHNDLRSTKHMREAGERWLPRRALESPTTSTTLSDGETPATSLKSAFDQDPFAQRLGETYLRPVYWEALEDQSAAIINGPAIIDEQASDTYKDLMRDVDDEGTSLESFSKRFVKSALHRGLCHIFVDSAVVEEGATEADRGDNRPYWVLLDASQVIGWRHDERGRLTQVRFVYQERKDEGNWGSRLEDRCKVITPEGWELYGKDDSENDLEISSGELEFDRILWHTLYVNRTGFFQAAPYNDELAWVNLDLWQKASAKNNYLYWALVAGIVFAGFDDTDIPGALGTAVKLTTDNANAKPIPFGFPLEPVEAAQRDIDHLMKVAQWLSRRSQMEKPLGTRTATETLINSQQGDTDLSRISFEAQATLNAAGRDFGEYYGNEEFGDWLEYEDVSALPSESMGSVLQTLEALRDLDREARKVAIREAQARNVLAEDVDVMALAGEVGDGSPPSAQGDRMPDNSIDAVRAAIDAATGAAPDA